MAVFLQTHHQNNPIHEKTIVMKKLASLTVLLAVAGLLNVGCTASAGIHKADNTKVSTTAQVAYTTAPSK